MKWLYRAGLAAILLIAAGLRLTGIDWDSYQHHHPDERYIAWVATTIEFGTPGLSDWSGALDPQRSTFNPFRWPENASSEGIVVLQDQPRDFAYGHLPLYLGVLATRFAEAVGRPLAGIVVSNWTAVSDVLNIPQRIEFRHLTAVGRALTALVDVATVLLAYVLGKRLHGREVGLLSAALLAVAVLHIQLAHFFITDTFLTFFVMLTLVALVAAYQSAVGKAGNASSESAPGASSPRASHVYLLLAGAAAGLAVGSKFSAILLVLPLIFTAWAIYRRVVKAAIWTGAVVAVGFAVFALTNPFAILDTSCPVTFELGPLPDLTIGSCYLDNIAVQNAMVRGQLDLGFTRQYAGTLPYVYFLEMQWRWGLGPVLGLTALAGAFWAIWAAVRGWRTDRGTTTQNAANNPVIELTILLLWILPYFLVTGSFYVKFMRYMQPLLPPLLVLAALALWQLRQPVVRGTAIAIVLGFTSLYALAFVNLYGEPHPWNAASEWIHRNVPAGSLILSEQWDDYLPTTMLVDGELRRREAYENAELTWLSFPDDLDNTDKLAANLELLAQADYLTVLSQRVYGVVPRLPERYPISSKYHQLLFDGELGYEPVWIGGRFPSLFGVNVLADLFGWPGLVPQAEVVEYLDQVPALQMGRVDESFTVYDQPLTVIFRNDGRLSVDQLRAAFELDQ